MRVSGTYIHFSMSIKEFAGQNISGNEYKGNFEDYEGTLDRCQEEEEYNLLRRRLLVLHRVQILSSRWFIQKDMLYSGWTENLVDSTFHYNNTAQLKIYNFTQAK